MMLGKKFDLKMIGIKEKNDEKKRKTKKDTEEEMKMFEERNEILGN